MRQGPARPAPGRVRCVLRRACAASLLLLPPLPGPVAAGVPAVGGDPAAVDEITEDSVAAVDAALAWLASAASTAEIGRAHV